MSLWQEDKRWSDRFLHEIKGIIGQAFIVEPLQEEDAEHNTDLIVLKFDSIRVACRIRKHQYLLKYSDEFTIRFGRPSRAKTELAKIIEGWGDYLFYGFSDEAETKLAKWTIINLDSFRLWFSRMIIKNKGGLPGKVQQNSDNSSSFIAFSLYNNTDIIYSKSDKI